MSEPYNPDIVPVAPSLLAPLLSTGALRGVLSAWPNDGGDDPLERATAQARRLGANDRSSGSRDKYARCWAQFVHWIGADERLRSYDEVPAMPAVVGLYVGSLRDRKLTKATILVHLAAIGYAHEMLGFPPPWEQSAQLKSQIRGLRREEDGDRQERAAIERDMATDVLLALPEPTSLKDIRDRFIFCLGWTTALRRSNIAALRRRDINIEYDALHQRRYLDVLIRRSKTDQEGQGRHIVVTELPGTHPLCAVRALERWLSVTALEPDAPLLQSVTLAREINQKLTDALDPKDVARAVKRLLEQAGLDTTKYAAHSLRRGFATTMQNAGVPDGVAMEHGGWKSKDTYYRYNRVDKARKNAIRDLFN
jgi:hypothetical protein